MERNARSQPDDPQDAASIPCLIRLRGLYAGLTTAERRVADTILAAPGAVMQASITEVAKQSEVGVGTVGRLCGKLGYSGFPALKIALAMDLAESDEPATGLLQPGDGVQALIEKGVQMAVRNLHNTADLLDVQAVQRAVLRLRAASLVTLYAASPVDHAVAQMLAYRLLQVNVPARLLVHPPEQALHARQSIAGEAIIIVAWSGEAPAIAEAAAGYDRGQDRFVLLLTNALRSPLAHLASLSLVAVGGHSGPVVSDATRFMGLYALVDVLYSALALLDASGGDLMADDAPRRAHPEARLDTLRIGVPHLPTTMDPQQTLSIANGRIYPLVFNTLLTRDWTGSDWKLLPSLAMRWLRQDDHTLDLTLRDDVRWHDGVPFTPDDVIYTFSRLQSRDSALHVARSGFWSLERVEQIGPHQVRIVSQDPDPFLEMRLASHHVAYILPAHHHRAVGAAAFAGGQTIGTGPYRLQTWREGEAMTFSAHDAYFGGPPRARQIVIAQEPHPADRTARLLAGSYDLITDVAPDQLAAIDGGTGYHTRSEIIGLDYELLFNMQAAPMDRREIRQALSLAIDRRYLIEELWQGFAVHPRGSQIPGEDFYDPDRPHLPFDPGRAQALLERGGYAGESIRFAALSPDYYILDSAMVEAIAAMWREIGVRVEVIYFASSNERGQHIRAGDRQYHVMEISTGSYNDMRQRLVGMWGRNSDFQRSRYWSPASARRYNDLIDALAATQDASTRHNLYRKLLDELEYEVPGTPVLIPELIYAMRGDIDITPNIYQGLDLTPANFHLLSQFLDEGDG